MKTTRLITGDALKELRKLPDDCVHCCVTSPPYWGLRDYQFKGQMGLEPTPERFVARLVEVLREVRRVLRDDGTLWLNLGDSYANDGKWGGSSGGKHATALHGNTGIGRLKVSTGLKPKDLIGIPWRVAFALQDDGWWLRSEIIWHKPNPMPESVTDRPTKAHEQIFLLAKSERYFYDANAIKEPTTGSAHDRARKDRSATGQKTLPTAERNGMRAPGVNPKAQKWPNGWSAEPGRHDGAGNGRFRPKQNASFSAAVVQTVDERNRRTVWTISTKPFKGAHFATFPPALIEPCILGGCPPDGTVLDPFAGAGTTALVAEKLGRSSISIELKSEYVKMARARLRAATAIAAHPKVLNGQERTGQRIEKKEPLPNRWKGANA